MRKPLNTTPAHLPPYLPNTPDMFFGLGRWARNAVNSGKLPDFAKANTGIGGAGIGADRDDWRDMGRHRCLFAVLAHQHLQPLSGA